MSDARLRQLERQFQKTGSAEDERAYLREGVRVGQFIETGCIRLNGNQGANIYLGDRCETIEWSKMHLKSVISMAVAKFCPESENAYHRSEALHLLSKQKSLPEWSGTVKTLMSVYPDDVFGIGTESSVSGLLRLRDCLGVRSIERFNYPHIPAEFQSYLQRFVYLDPARHRLDILDEVNPVAGGLIIHFDGERVDFVVPRPRIHGAIDTEGEYLTCENEQGVQCTYDRANVQGVFCGNGRIQTLDDRFYEANRDLIDRSKGAGKYVPHSRMARRAFAVRSLDDLESYTSVDGITLMQEVPRSILENMIKHYPSYVEASE